MSSVKQENCSNCGEIFPCGAKSGEERCWCDAMPHLPLSAIAGRDCFCPRCLSNAIQNLNSPSSQVGGRLPDVITRPLEPQRLLVEGEDYYSEGGMIVFTASYHRRRGYCCESACRHCPYK